MTVWLAVGAALTRADIPCLCAGLADQLRARPGPGDVVCDASAARPDVVTVEALARLRLTAGRHGRRFIVHDAPPELVSLFGLMGLGGFLAAAEHARRSVLRVEPGGQAEDREEPLGVEEVVDPGDPAV
ncbi:STAS domain-containing protein [Actinoplanes solisilvae]|uniref:STAS domain-containing protein n=1 Tax=Actinoplanes solisilvae TaxID=2486853 RepID=UPI000FD75D55|nr:STAS domain-containing protein [Actinoplanes solisilvae]